MPAQATVTEMHFAASYQVMRERIFDPGNIHRFEAPERLNRRRSVNRFDGATVVLGFSVERRSGSQAESFGFDSRNERSYRQSARR